MIVMPSMNAGITSDTVRKVRFLTVSLHSRTSVAHTREGRTGRIGMAEC